MERPQRYINFLIDKVWRLHNIFLIFLKIYITDNLSIN